MLSPTYAAWIGERSSSPRVQPMRAKRLAPPDDFFARALRADSRAFFLARFRKMRFLSFAMAPADYQRPVLSNKRFVKVQGVGKGSVL